MSAVVPSETMVQTSASELLGSDPPIAEHDSLSLDDILLKAKHSYVDRLVLSRTHFERAVKFMPGGNTRSVLFTEPFPITMRQGRGNRLWDLDGNEYLDFVGELTAGLYGHSHPRLQKAMNSAYENLGVNLGAHTEEETTFAELICKRFPSIEQLRFCNSGTEANLYALSIARHITGKRKVIVFDGGYHGGVLSFGHGIEKNTVDQEDWVLGVYNDVEGTRSLIESTSGVAAVIVEAMQGAGGCIPATLDFLMTIQATAAKCGILFILDEVMTSRLHPGGLQSRYSLSPDLTTLGKYLGGGLAFGAFGGRKSLLAAYDPRVKGSLPHSGTFNNNTLAMVCGFVGLSEIYTPEAAVELNALGDYFRTGLQEISKGSKMVVTGVGAALTIHFLENGQAPVRAADLAKHSVGGLKKLFWYWCTSQGFWTTERGMLSIILGTTKEEVDSYIASARAFIVEYEPMLKLRK